MLLEGSRLVRAAVDAGVALDTVFSVDEDAPDTFRFDPSLLVLCDERVLRHVATTTNPQSVVAVARWRPEPSLADLSRRGSGDPSADGVLVLDGISDPGNLGTLVRTAAAFGCRRVVTTTGSCDVTNPKALRASAGAMFRVAVHADRPADDVVVQCRTAGMVGIAAVARGGERPARPDGPWALWIGSEAHGLAPDRIASLDRAVTLPISADVDSLNAAAAGAVLLAVHTGSVGPDR